MFPVNICTEIRPLTSGRLDVSYRDQPHSMMHIQRITGLPVVVNSHDSCARTLVTLGTNEVSPYKN